jgi:hypothetical protein
MTLITSARSRFWQVPPDQPPKSEDEVVRMIVFDFVWDLIEDEEFLRLLGDPEDDYKLDIYINERLDRMVP